jgi:hypothetical protein
MALSPADFAAYSRATGTSYPESPEERALMVPEVRAFRQNQLQAQPKQESNSLALGLGIGLGLAGVGGGLMALRGRAKKGAKKDVAGKSSVKVTDLSDQPVPKSKTAVYADVAVKPKKDLPDVRRPKGESNAVAESDLYKRMRISKDGYLDYPEVSREVEEARRAARAETRSAINQNRKSTYQGEIPGIQADLITSLRSKEVSPFTTKKVSPFATQEELSQLGIVQYAPSRSLSIAPDQQSLFGDGQKIPTKQTPQSFLERYQERDQPAAMTAVEQYRQMTGSDPYKEAPKKGLLKAQEGTRQRIEDLGNIVLADLQNDATLEQQANTVINELRQEPTTLVTSQESRLPILQEQATDALASTDDNVTNRVRLDAQRNEDLDLATGIERPATGDPFGKSTETAQDVNLIQENRQVSAKAFLENERDEIASQIAEQGLIVTPGRIEKELANRLGTEAYQYGPKYIKRKHALELGATYDPAFFENLNVSSVKIAGQNVPVNPTKQTRVSRTEMLGTPFEEDVQVGLKVPVTGKLGAAMVKGKAENKLDWLGSVRLEEANKTAADNARLINTNREYNSLVNYQTEILDALERTDLTLEQRTRGRQTLSDVQIELDRLDARSEELNQRVAGGQGGARVRGAQKYVANYLEDLTPSPRLKPGSDEGMRIAYQVDTEGNPLPNTQELVSERRIKDTKVKGGGGRNVAEFTAGTRDEGIEVDMENVFEQLKTPPGQSAREYEFDQFGYRPGTGLTGEALEGKPFRDDKTQTGRVITRTGIQKSGPQPGTMKGAVNPFTQLDNETLGMISLQGDEADAVNATRVLARRRREGFDPASATGPGQSQRIITSVETTPKQKQVTTAALRDSEIMRRKAIEGRNPQSSLSGRAQQQSRPRIAALRQEAALRKAAGSPLMTKKEAFAFLNNYN